MSIYGTLTGLLYCIRSNISGANYPGENSGVNSLLLIFTHTSHNTVIVKQQVVIGVCESLSAAQRKEECRVLIFNIRITPPGNR